MNENITKSNIESLLITFCRDEKVKECALLEARPKEEKIPSSIESLSKLGLLGDL